MINTTLNNRYRIETEIGRGGMGVVYRAQDTLLERPVAVKVISEAALGTEGRSRLLSEARAAAKLNHPNIVAVHDAGEVEGRPYIVMELVEGQTLRDYEPAKLREIVDITTDICEALSAAHEQGIIHRDLKPENVALTLDGAIKLMDFGLAHISGKSRLTQTGAVVGTVSYLAPEVIMGGEATAQSDLYALGVMLYEMSAGRPPFEGDSLTAVISQHLHAPVVPPSAYNEAIPPTLDEIIVGLLSKRLERRPRSAAELGSALGEITLTVSEAQPAAGARQLNRLVRGRMVGRESELAEAVRLWERAAGGDGQLLLISGEPGIGKTRLVKELSAYAEISGGKTLLGQCYAEEPTPYGPIAQMVLTSLGDGFQAEHSTRAEPSIRAERKFSLELPDSVLADLRTLSPELALAFPDVRLDERPDLEAEQQRLFKSLLTWFSTLSQQDHKLLMVVDDVHWADSGSLSLLRYLARRLGQHRALVVVTYREAELDEAVPFQKMLLELDRERSAASIKLTRLDLEGTRRLLATLFAEEITFEFLEGIYRETEGNPFFIEEVCKSLVDGGKLTFEDGRWQRPTGIAELEIPQGIRATIQGRLSRLSTVERSVLQTAALLGRKFEYEMLAVVAELGEGALIEALESSENAQLIEEVQGAGQGDDLVFSFTHALIHSTLLTNLSTLRRRRMQRKMALALEERFPNRRQELALLLGRYFAEAGDGDKGVTYLTMAGDAARDVYAYDEAIRAYEQALIILREVGDHERAARTLMKLGLVQHNIFAFEASRQAYEEGLAEWHLAGEVLEHMSRASAPHALRFSRNLGPSTLDPAYSDDDWSRFFINQLFSGLLETTAEDELVPGVAESWEILNDGHTYVFHLRDDVYWSDGVSTTATDFEFAWKRSLAPGNDRGLSEMLFVIQGARDFKKGRLGDGDGVGVRAADDLTLVVDLEAPCSYFLQLMAIPYSLPVPRHVVERHGDDWTDPDSIVSNGPYRLKSFIPEHSLILDRYGDYHGRSKGNISGVRFKIMPSSDSAALYEQDKLDLLMPFSGQSFQDAWRFARRHPDDYVTMPSAQTDYLTMNVTEPPFDNPALRQALVLAIDRENLANRVRMGICFPATGGFVPPGVAGHVPGIALPYDPALARQKLAQAGFPGGEDLPLVSGICSRSGGAPFVLEHIVEQWKSNLGLQVEFEALDNNTLAGRLRSERPTILLWGWMADYPDADNFLHYASWLRYSGWRHERYEALVEDARGVADQSLRVAMYRQAEQILVEETPVVPISYGRLNWLLKPWLSGRPVSIINGLNIKDLVIEPH